MSDELLVILFSNAVKDTIGRLYSKGTLLAHIQRGVQQVL